MPLLIVKVFGSLTLFVSLRSCIKSIFTDYDRIKIVKRFSIHYAFIAQDKTRNTTSCHHFDLL